MLNRFAETMRIVFRVVIYWVNLLNYPILALYYYKYVQWKYERMSKKLKNKDKIKVAFFLIHDSVWKYDGVYHLMENDDRFDPVVVVCPYMSYGYETMLNDMNQAYKYFISQRYNVVKTYDEKSKKWLNVKKVIKPDIVFFTNPHKLTLKQYYISNYLDCLTCYVPYSFQMSYLYQEQYNQPFHNLLWRAFYETTIHKKIAEKYSTNKGQNVIVTGYPGTEKFIDSNYCPNDPWKIKEKKVKRIIWAPHHTIESDGISLCYSNFIRYSNFMLEIAHTFNDKIQIAFKPHPILKLKLSQDKNWGYDKTKIYYQKWDTQINCQLCESDYTDLFLTSDALIHDSGSFLVEYLFVNKPTLFLLRDSKVINRFNDFGKLAIKQHYLAYSETDIMDFINYTILSDQDELLSKRSHFLKTYLILSKSESPSKYIFNEIIGESC